MSNTVDVAVMAFDEEECETAIRAVHLATGWYLEIVSDMDRCGGPRICIFEVAAGSFRCEGKAKTEALIEAFKNALFSFGEHAVLNVSDDDNEGLSGIYRPATENGEWE